MFEQKLAEFAQTFEVYMDQLLPRVGERGEARLVEAMRYAALSGGN